jgi:hypothetical protein
MPGYLFSFSLDKINSQDYYSGVRLRGEQIMQSHHLKVNINLAGYCPCRGFFLPGVCSQQTNDYGGHSLPWQNCLLENHE